MSLQWAMTFVCDRRLGQLGGGIIIYIIILYVEYMYLHCSPAAAAVSCAGLVDYGERGHPIAASAAAVKDDFQLPSRVSSTV